MPQRLAREEFEDFGSEGLESTPSGDVPRAYDGGTSQYGADGGPARSKPLKEAGYPWGIDLPIALAPAPTNPGSRDHPHCNPCSFVFRLAGDYVRLRCVNADTCQFCHHASHPRNRSRKSRRKERRTRQDRQVRDVEDQDDLLDVMQGDLFFEQRAQITIALPRKDEACDLPCYVMSPMTEDCELLFQWASEFGPLLRPALTDSDRKSKELGSATTVASTRDY
jgi:hypothetical protein